jgi:hypothetical protein
LIKSLDLAENNNDLMLILARTEGAKFTDCLRLFPEPEINENGQYQFKFFAHGLRYLPRYLVDNIFDILIKNPTLIQVKVIQVNLETIPIKYRLEIKKNPTSRSSKIGNQVFLYLNLNFQLLNFGNFCKISLTDRFFHIFFQRVKHITIELKSIISFSDNLFCHCIINWQTI